MMLDNSAISLMFSFAKESDPFSELPSPFTKSSSPFSKHEKPFDFRLSPFPKSGRRLPRQSFGLQRGLVSCQTQNSSPKLVKWVAPPSGSFSRLKRAF